MPVGGNLTIYTAGGRDGITLRRVSVTGNTTIKTGAGADEFVAEWATLYSGTFFADFGVGHDTISLAQTGTAGFGARFAGKATVLTRYGNDTLKLGSALILFSKAEFLGAGSKIDGGAGLNSFDDETGQFSGVALGTGIINWTDPT